MTGPEHYARAEKFLDLAEAAGDEDQERMHLHYAQVHATLAQAAATALSGVDQAVNRREQGYAALSRTEANAWGAVAAEGTS